MGVHLVFGPALPLHVLEREAGQSQAPAVGEDEACPRDEQAVLPDGHLVVVGADEPRALGDEQQTLCPRVVDIAAHLGHEVARKVGGDPGEEKARDDRAGAERVGRASGLEQGTHCRAAHIAR